MKNACTKIISLLLSLLLLWPALPVMAVSDEQTNNAVETPAVDLPQQVDSGAQTVIVPDVENEPVETPQTEPPTEPTEPEQPVESTPEPAPDGGTPDETPQPSPTPDNETPEGTPDASPEPSPSPDGDTTSDGDEPVDEDATPAPSDTPTDSETSETEDTVSEEQTPEQLNDERLAALLRSPYFPFYSPAKVAEYLSQIVSAELYDELLRHVLDYYYLHYNPDRIALFKSSADERSAAILAEYDAALAERQTENIELGYSSGEIIVTFNNNEITPEMQSIFDAMSFNISQQLGKSIGLNTAVVSIPIGYTVESACELIASLDFVEAAQPNIIHRMMSDMRLPDSEPVGEAVSGTAATTYPIDDVFVKYGDSWYLDKVQAFDAWELLDTYGYTKVRVAVIDTGCDVNHSDLQASLNKTLSRDLSGNNNVVLTADKDIHGTHVCGTIAATANNYLGAAGVASGLNNNYVDLVAIGAGVEYNDPTYGLQIGFGTVDLVEAISYAVNNDCRVINMSLGGYYEDPAMEAACDAAVAAGTVVVCAAGNGTTNFYSNPSDIESVISVIATTNYTDPTTECSASFSDFGEAKDISAPGVDIINTVPTAYSDYGVAYLSGTSMASPIVAAVAAMVLAADPTLTVSEVKNVLYTTATDLYTPGWDQYTGWGNVNACAAVKALDRYPPTCEGLTATLNAAGDGFTITATGVSDPNGVSQVRFAVWCSTVGGQDDLVWYTADKQGGGTYTKTVNVYNHKSQAGTYYVYVYGTDSKGNYGAMKKTTLAAAPDTTKPKCAALTAALNAAGDGFTITATGVFLHRRTRQPAQAALQLSSANLRHK